MIFEVRKPGGPLDPFVESIIYHRGYVPGHTRERILAYGAMDLVVDLTETPKQVFDNETLIPESHYRLGWISGMRCKPITIECGSGGAMLVVRFRPGGARAFFDFPMSELSERVEEAECIWGTAFFDFREQLLGKAPRKAIDTAEAWLLRRINAKLDADRQVNWAIKAILRRPIPPSVRELSRELGYSHKHLVWLFQGIVGLSPKRFARVVRFQRIVGKIESCTPNSWSAFAQDFGFYDQAHFNHEFKAFAGMAPETYIAKKGPLLNFMPAN